MVKASIVELQRAETLREETLTNLRLASKLFEIACHDRVILPKLTGTTTLADYLRTIYGAAMWDLVGNDEGEARHDRVETRRMVKAAEELVERVRELVEEKLEKACP